MAAAGLRHNRSHRVKVLAVQIATICTLIILWESVSRLPHIYEGVAPSILQIAMAGWELISNAFFYRHLLTTVVEIVVGFAVASLIGVLLGIVLGIRQGAARIADFWLSALAATPKIVFLPIVMLIVGIGPPSKVALGALSGFFPIALSTMAGTMHVRKVLIDVGRSFNLSKWHMLVMIYLPHLSGPILRGMRLGLGVTVVGVLLAEIKLSNVGLGYLAIDYYNRFEIADMYAILIVIFLLAAATNVAMNKIGDYYERH